MHKQRIGVLVSCIVGAVAAFLPWAHALGVTFAGIQGDGKISLAMFVAALVPALVGARSNAMSVAARVLSSIFAIAPVGLGLWKIHHFSASMGRPGNLLEAALAQSTGVDFGLYLTIVAGIAVPVILWTVSAGGESHQAAAADPADTKKVLVAFASISVAVVAISLGVFGYGKFRNARERAQRARERAQREEAILAARGHWRTFNLSGSWTFGADPARPPKRRERFFRQRLVALTELASADPEVSFSPDGTIPAVDDPAIRVCLGLAGRFEDADTARRTSFSNPTWALDNFAESQATLRIAYWGEYGDRHEQRLIANYVSDRAFTIRVPEGEGRCLFQRN